MKPSGLMTKPSGSIQIFQRPGTTKAMLSLTKESSMKPLRLMPKSSSWTPTMRQPGATKAMLFMNWAILDEAIPAYDEAIRLDPNISEAWHNKGLALEALGRTAEADAAFARAKELVATGPDS